MGWEGERERVGWLIWRCCSAGLHGADLGIESGEGWAGRAPRTLVAARVGGVRACTAGACAALHGGTRRRGAWQPRCSGCRAGASATAELRLERRCGWQLTDTLGRAGLLRLHDHRRLGTRRGLPGAGGVGGNGVGRWRLSGRRLDNQSEWMPQVMSENSGGGKHTLVGERGTESAVSVARMNASDSDGSSHAYSHTLATVMAALSSSQPPTFPSRCAVLVDKQAASRSRRVGRVGARCTCLRLPPRRQDRERTIVDRAVY